jgi:hypothetical protein
MSSWGFGVWDESGAGQAAVDQVGLVLDEA